VTQDVAVLNELFAQGVVAVIGDIFLLIGIVGAMLWLDWKLALVTLTTVPLLVVATAVFRAKVRVSYRRVRTRLARLNGFLQEHLQGLDILKVFNVEAKETRRFDQANRDHYVAHLQNMFHYAVFFPTVELIGAVGLALILWYGGLGILKGGHVRRGGGVHQYVDRFYQPVRDLSDKYNVFKRRWSRRSGSSSSGHAARRARARVAARRGPLKGEVEFDHVWFAYKDEEYVLRDLSFRIRPGRKWRWSGRPGRGRPPSPVC
jgi:ATP-binding cassette subfamily B protein